MAVERNGGRNINGGEVIALFAIGIGALIVLIPLSVFAVRQGLNPLAEALIKLREGFAGEQNATLSRRMFELEDEVRELREKVTRLGEAEGFYQKLRGSEAVGEPEGIRSFGPTFRDAAGIPPEGEPPSGNDA